MRTTLHLKHDDVRLVALDMSKAFDTVIHSAIIFGLETLQPPLHKTVVNWAADFLSGRMHFNSINNACSDILQTDQGVPQGKIGGPLGQNRLKSAKSNLYLLVRLRNLGFRRTGNF